MKFFWKSFGKVLYIRKTSVYVVFPKGILLLLPLSCFVKTFVKLFTCLPDFE